MWTEHPLFKAFHSAFERIKSLHELPWCLEVISHNFPNDLMRQREALEKILARRSVAEPLAYILGSWAFREHEFAVGPGVLIPRPETEELVEIALQRLSPLCSDKRTLRIADLGAGSGCIGLSLASEFSQKHHCRIELHLVEKSPAAYEYLKKNIESFRSERVDIHTHLSDWAQWANKQSGSDLSFDAIVSNPPYISHSEYLNLDASVKDFEPAEALRSQTQSESDPECRQLYTELLELSSKLIDSNSYLLFELGPAQIPWILSLAKSLIPEADWSLLNDITSRPRFLQIKTCRRQRH